ncbi:glycosyltransferase [Candidatus Cloacimonadaceae bacterium]
MNSVFTISTALYVAFLAWVLQGLKAILAREAKKPEPVSNQAISIIVAARNEEHNLPSLLDSLSKLNYPSDMYEIIIVNDHSEDNTAKLLDSYKGCPNLRIIHFYEETPPLTGKKAALNQGILAATNDILAFTDADCLLPQNWLIEINHSMDAETDYLLAYSIMKRQPDGSTFRSRNFERSVYYALAAAGLHYHRPITSSACNMVYRKSLFEKSGGWDGIGHLRSGDDDLLLMKMMPQIRKAAYNPSPDMQVVSIDGTDAKQHHQTNIRRASKLRYYPLWLKLMSIGVFSYFCLFYYALIKSLTGKGGLGLAAILLTKTAAEFSLVFYHLKKINHAELSWLYPVQIFLFPAQFIFYALRGSLGKYRWK